MKSSSSELCSSGRLVRRIGRPSGSAGRAILAGIALALLAGGGCAYEDLANPALCSDDWYRQIEASLATGDGMGHGPDIGSDEWKSVIEFRLGVRGEPEVPPRTSEAWCSFVDSRLANQATRAD